MTPRAVTGIGILSAIGIGREAFFDAIGRGAAPAVEAASAFENSTHGLSVAEVPGFDAAKFLGDKGLRALDRLSKLCIVAARLALADAGLKRDGAWAIPLPEARPWPERTGLVISNAYGSLEAISELDRVALLEDPRYINPSRFPLTVSNTAAGYVSIWEELRALNVSVSDGNCGALDAVACADTLLGAKRADALLVGGAEALSDPLFVAFRRLRGGRKVDSDGAGRVGEGAVLLALETSDGARRRGAESLAEIVGYGTSFATPQHEGSIFSASPDALQRAVEGALEDARTAAGEVDLVVSGIAGIDPFDTAELRAITAVFGDPCIATPKRILGEALGAGAALGIATAIAAMRDGIAEGLLRGPLRRPVRTAVVTSMGYYGNASALVLRTSTR